MFLNNIDLYCKNLDTNVICLLEQIIPIPCEQTFYHMIALAVFILIMNFLGSVCGTDGVNNWDMKREGERFSTVISKASAATLYIQNSLARIQYLQRRESILDHRISVAIKKDFQLYRASDSLQFSTPKLNIYFHTFFVLNIQSV
jgi:hypothetical protein